MKAAFFSLLTLALVLGAGVLVYAEDKKEEKGKEVELKGTIACAKCNKWVDAKIHGGKCVNAIKVKEKKDDKEVEVIYLFIDKGRGEDYHKCSGTHPGHVKGVVSKKKETAEQLYITPTKDTVKYDD